MTNHPPSGSGHGRVTSYFLANKC